MNKYDILKNIKSNIENREKNIYLFRNSLNTTAERRVTDISKGLDHRQSFSVDADRIIHSLAYARYIDKTQVFSLISNDHIAHRALHVQLVSKIARTIGKFLFLNEDLIEAIALGHDIGHAPFGHDGEIYLSKLCNKAGIDNFLHNVQSVHCLDKVEKKGKGLNLCLQTLDGILCHDGETHDDILIPNYGKTFKTLDKETNDKRKNPSLVLMPMTLEGCIVRVSDVISYIGRDFEDAIRLKLIKRSELPKKISKCIGNTNGSIVYRLVTDLIKNSFNTETIRFSSEISEILKFFKKFNLKRIYTNSKIKKYHKTIEKLFEILFEICIENLEGKNSKSDIFSNFLEGMSEEYLHFQKNEEIVRDYIAGMTDRYFLSQVKKIKLKIF